VSALVKAARDMIDAHADVAAKWQREAATPEWALAVRVFDARVERLASVATDDSGLGKAARVVVAAAKLVDAVNETEGDFDDGGVAHIELNTAIAWLRTLLPPASVTPIRPTVTT
jgi:hypothetical protein